MSEQRRFHSVEKLARVLRVSRSGYYAWAGREPSRRATEDERLVAEIRELQERVAKYRYGSPRMTRELRRRGRQLGHNRVARLMREHGLAARGHRQFRVTTRSKDSQWHAENVLARRFDPAMVNSVWASDITYIPSAEGWLYLCVIIDLYSRKIIGWAMTKRLNTELVLQALWMAIMRRRPPRGVIFHTDRGVQYASNRFRRVLKRNAFLQSMSRKGDCWDNACVESFFKTLKRELIGHRIYHTRKEAQVFIFEYIEVFYNRVRLHSTLGYITPEECEQRLDRKVG